MNARLHPTLALALPPMAPAASMVHKVLADDRALQADLDYLNKLNSGEFERRRDIQAVCLERQSRDAIGGVL